MQKCKILVQLFLTLLLTGTAAAKTVNFNISDYHFDNAGQEIRLRNELPVSNRYYHNFRIPVVTVSEQNLYSVPQKLQIFSIKKRLVLTGVNFSERSRDSLQVYENFNNLPVSLAAAGFARGNGILNLEFTPFIFSNDSLFFVESVEYSFSDYQLPLLPYAKLNEEYDLLIVAPQSAVQALEQYRLFKEQNGIKTRIAAVENICTTTAGTDRANKIRNYIKECYRNQKIKSVLLAGSSTVIPAVIFKNDASSDDIPSDQFYSNLDKEFDSNNNGLFADNYDMVDFYPDVTIGRWPGSTAAELQKMAEKAIRYYKGNISARPDFYRSLSLIAFNLFSPGDSEAYCEMVKETTSGLTAPDSIYQNISSNFSQSSVYAAINHGYNLIYIQAHGNYNKFGVPNGWGIYSDHLYYSQAVSGMYMIASCHPGDFAANAMVIKTMLSQTGGCIFYVGTSGLEYPSMSQLAHKHFMQNLVNLSQTGGALTSARISGFSNLSTSPVTRQLYYGYNLQGDPTGNLFMRQPQLINISSVSNITKGRGTVTGQLDIQPLMPVTVTLSNANGLLTSTIVGGRDFTLNYENLFADSVTIALSSPDIFFRSKTLATTNTSQDIQIKNLTVTDENNSGIVENGEKFSIALELQSLGQPLSDSLILVMNCPYLNLTGTAKIKTPANANPAQLNLFDFAPDLSLLQADTSLACRLQIFTTGSSNTQIYEKKFLLTVANPKLVMSSVRYLNGNITIPVLANLSAGRINQIEVTLIGINKNKEEILTTITLKNIAGHSLITDSLLYVCDPLIQYKLRITNNQQNIYETRTFYRSQENPNIADSLNLHCSYVAKNLMLNWDRQQENIRYNIYVYAGDTLTSTAPVNQLPLNITSFTYYSENILPYDTYLKIGLVDDESGSEFIRSGFIHINPVPQYGNAPYALLPFQLYNPVRLGSRIIANAESGCIVSIPSNGNFSGNGQLYNSLTHGVQNDYLQGRAFGDVNNDGHQDIINLTWCGYDSVYLQAVDLETGLLLAKRSVYGYGKFNTPVLANIDGDAQPEILLTLFNGPNGDSSPKGSYLYAFDCDNGSLSLKNGFPLYSGADSWNAGAPVVADLDNDSNRELIYNCGGNLEVYRLSDLTKITDFALTNVLTGDLVICDINDDSKPEIIGMLANANSAETGKLRVLKFENGTISDVAGFENGLNLETNAYNFNKPGVSPVAADMDLDGEPEIIALTGKKIYIFKANGQPFGNFPITLPSSITDNNINSPSLADLDGDGILDILFMDGTSRIRAYSGSSGVSLSGFPLYVPASQKNHFGSLDITDLDNDNDLEIICGARGGMMYIYDYPIKTTTRNTYCYYRGDLANSGRFERTDVVSIQNSANKPQDFTILSQYPNPFNPSTSISFYLPKAADVQFKVYNSCGQLVHQTKNSYTKAGIQTVNFNGSSLSSGLYIYTLQHGSEIRVGKCALLK